MRFIIAAALALLATGASAQPVLDHHAMLKQLRASGIDPALVNWAEVDPLCVGFINYRDDPTEYNACRFAKAQQEFLFRGDRETCQIEALAVTPESLRKQPRVTIGTLRGGEGNDTLTTISTPKISRSEMKTARAATYNRCMRDLSWRNPNNWRLGQTN